MHIKTENDINYSNQRIYYFDNLKAFLIFLVVIGHFLSYTPNPNSISTGVIVFIQSFYMQFFLLVNGYFYSKNNIRFKVLSFTLIGIILKVVLALISKKITFNLFVTQNIPWYLFALSIFYIVAHFMNNVNLIKVILVNVLLFNLVIFDKNVNHTFCLVRIIAFFPYFLIGIIIKKYSDEILLIYNEYKHILKIASICILVIWGDICFFHIDLIKVLRKFIPAHANYTGFEQYFYLKTVAFLICIILMIAIAVLIPKKKIPLISSIGTKTLQIYFWHTIFRNLLLRFNINKVVNNEVWLFFSLVTFLVCTIDVFKYPTEWFLPKNIVD